MMTLMPVAAFADADDSYVFTDDKNAEASVKEDVTIQFDLADGAATTVYVWFVKDGSKEATTNVTFGGETAKYGVFELTDVVSGDDYDFQFTKDDKYTVQAAFENPVSEEKYGTDNSDYKTLAEAFSNAAQKLGTLTDQKTIEITTSTSSRDYGMIYVSGPDVTKIEGALQGEESSKVYDSETEVDGVLAKAFGDGVDFYVEGVKANNVTDKTVTLKFVDEHGDAVKGETVTFETGSANIELNKEKATTDRLGKVDFKIAGVRDGEYKIYVKCGSYEATIYVTVGATGAYNIQVAKAPTAPFDVTSDLEDKIQFTFTDANGNAVTADQAEKNGAVAAFNSINGKLADKLVNGEANVNCKPYVAVVSKPSASKLENEDLYLVADAHEGAIEGNVYRANLALDSGTKDLAEGTYEVKVVLDNGKYVTVTFEVKEFTTPVALNLTYEADAVELDSQVAIDTLEWVDANGVTKSAKKKVDLAATGYAVADFDTETGLVTVKKDDKYVGSKITVVAVDDRYNLTAQATLTVADEASALAFDTKTLAIDVNNKVKVSVVDSEGNRVALNRSDIKDAAVSYVVLDKPEGSKVSVSTDGADNKLTTEGTFVMNVTANTVGNVTIQAVAKVTKTNVDTQKDVVRYYTGTQIFAVGKDSVGQVVVMSIGSNEIIVNDAKGTIDAAPMIQNDRTYVPFRALAEAFGAEVAYDEATQAVTAELNGVTVVMTIGSATYTVNGAEQTMDVAPFISGSRTMIPVRFAAEAFGIKVIPTYNPDGSTADILFNL